MQTTVYYSTAESHMALWLSWGKGGKNKCLHFRWKEVKKKAFPLLWCSWNCLQMHSHPVSSSFMKQTEPAFLSLAPAFVFCGRKLKRFCIGKVSGVKEINPLFTRKDGERVVITVKDRDYNSVRTTFIKYIYIYMSITSVQQYSAMPLWWGKLPARPCNRIWSERGWGAEEPPPWVIEQIAQT